MPFDDPADSSERARALSHLAAVVGDARRRKRRNRGAAAACLAGVVGLAIAIPLVSGGGTRSTKVFVAPSATTAPGSAAPSTAPPSTAAPSTTAQSIKAPTTTSTSRQSTSGTSTAETAPTSPATVPEGVSLRTVEWSAIAYPFSCGSTLQGAVGYRVAQVAYPTPSPGVEDAVVLVTCDSGAGTPPAELLVYDSATTATTPHLQSVLVSTSEDYQAASFTASGATIAIAVAGFSSPSVANCCPDIHRTLTWVWSNGSYRSA